MVAATLSLSANTMIMDEQWIEPIYLSQIFSAIYEDKTVLKMYLLSSIKQRSDAKGICSGDFAAMLLVDFLKSREKDDFYLKAKVKRGSDEKEKGKSLKFGIEQMYSTQQSGKKIEELGQFATLNTQELFSTPNKTAQEFDSPSKTKTEWKTKPSDSEFQWASDKNNLSERKAKTNQEIKKEQREKMM